MKLTEYMEQTDIAGRVERSRRNRALAWRSDPWRLKPCEQKMHGTGDHFPNLTDDERAQLAARGIDPERSFREFMVEIKVQGPPQRLLDDIFGGIPGVRTVDELFGVAAAA